MKLITSTKELKSFCKKIAKEEFITVDTEFMRERTYYPKLCLIQVAGKKDHAIIDPLSDKIDLAAFDEILLNPAIRKVMHGCRQDIEIFFKRLERVPPNIFDTQVAAMVCGFQESISYEALVKKYTDGTLDKSHRFTDWSARPLTEKQLEYAIGDVTWLYEIYGKMMAEIKNNKRMKWVDEEMASLNDPSLYRVEPSQAWEKLKARSNKPRFLALLQEVAAWREELAQKKDVPRNRIFRDEVLLEIAATAPQTTEALERVRNISHGYARSEDGKSLLGAIKRGLDKKREDMPKRINKTEYPSHITPIVEILRVLLKLKSDEFNVAPSMLASGDDLKVIAYKKDPDVPAMKGWRREIFGDDALSLKSGKTALCLVRGRLVVRPLKG